MHDTLTIGIPVFATLAGVLFNRSHLKGLRTELKGEIKGRQGEIKSLRDEVNRRFDAVVAELRSFHGTPGRLEGRIQSLESK